MLWIPLYGMDQKNISIVTFMLNCYWRRIFIRKLLKNRFFVFLTKAGALACCGPGLECIGSNHFCEHSLYKASFLEKYYEKNCNFLIFSITLAK